MRVYLLIDVDVCFYVGVFGRYGLEIGVVVIERRVVICIIKSDVRVGIDVGVDVVDVCVGIDGCVGIIVLMRVNRLNRFWLLYKRIIIERISVIAAIGISFFGFQLIGVCIFRIVLVGELTIYLIVSGSLGYFFLLGEVSVVFAGVIISNVAVFTLEFRGLDFSYFIS